MVNEFERKFLLTCVPKDIPFNSVSEDIFQLYLQDGRRFRAVVEQGGLVKYELITKTKVESGSNVEVKLEPSIIYTKEDALEQGLNYIEKRRTFFEFNGHKFFIDSFYGMALTVLEIETEAKDDEIVIPEFLADYIIIEVTQFDVFSNYNLSSFKRNG